ncbi:MAG: TetR/AcrR family transcriptional regulator [Actinomycetota bacterium]|nr:TetR/AcrR family transcriptional regulator [Actinomycetota bacterium]
MAQQTKARQQIPLSRDRVLQAAVAFADRAGFESLSMRKLAGELDAAPMALYRHVANKEDLLDGMIDIVFGEIESPPPGPDWKAAMRQRAIATREALSRHRWANGLMESRTRPGPASLRYHNAFMGCLREAGFPFRRAVHAYNAVQSYTYGFALQERYLSFETPEESAELARTTVGDHGAEYPYLAEVVVEFAKSGYDYTKEFEVALDLILDGIERLKQADSSTAIAPA